MSANGEFAPGIEEPTSNGLTGDVKNDRQYLIPGSLYKKYTDDPPTEGTPEKPKKPPKIGFFQLFRFADKLDYVMLTAGVIGAIGNGISWPFMVILFSTIVEDFVNQGKYEILLDKMSFVLDLFNISKDDARTDIDLFKPFCHILTNYTYNGKKIDCSFLENADNVFDSMNDSALKYVIGGVAIAICGFCQIYMFILSSERQIIKMRLAFYCNILRQEMAWFDHHSAGELAVKLTDDISKIHEAIGDKAATSIQFFAGSVAGFAVCFFYGWELALVLQIATPMLFISLACVSYFFTTITTKERKAYAKAGMVAEEVFSSMRTVHAFGGQEKEAQRYLRNLADASRFGSRKSFISGFSQGMTWLIIFCDWGLGLWYGGRLVRHDDYSVSDMMTVFFSAFIGCFSLGLAAPAFVIVNAGRGAAYSIYQILERKSEIDSSSTVGLKPATMTGRIQFKGLHFSYPTRSSVKILNGIDITVNQGQTVALVGSSGCGKSTLIQLLLRFYDADMGKVCLDGVDIRDINIKWLRQSIGHVGQEPVLFATSILENIRYGREGATMEEVVQACKDANAYDFIMKLPEKFETHVGERGAQLSGGQKQRIAIARALVKNPKVLLLDEATSALDNASEAVVQDALDRASKGRTTVVIAHRLSTIRQADVIVALDKGKVAERGTHEELMSKQGIYFHLVSHQMRQKELDNQSGSESDGGMAQIKLADENVLIERGAVDYGRQLSQVFSPDDGLDLSASANQTVKRLLKMNATEWHYIVMGSVASFINGALQPAWAVVLSEMIKSFSEDDKQDQKDTTRDMSLYSVGLGFASLITYFVQDYMFGLAGEALTLRMRDLLFRTILRQNIGWFDDRRHETGVLTTQLAVETSVVQGAVKTLVGCMWLSFGNLGTGFVISLIFGWQLALALMGFVPFIVMAGLLSIKFLGGAANESKTAMEDASKNALSCIDNIRTVAALTREEIFLAKFAHSLWEPFRNNVKSSIIAAGAFGFSFGIYYITFAVCFYYGSRLLKDDDIDYNDIFKVFGCVILGAMQFGRSVAFAPDANAAIKAARRIFALHDHTPLIDAYSDAGVRPSPDFKSTVRFADAFFRYPMRPDAVVLNGLNMSVEPGQTLALVGESGCGKSTTVQLIERFYDPEKGSVFLDKYDIKELNLQWLRAQIGLVSQEPILFDTSVAENIAYGDNSRVVPMDDIIKAAKAANIHNFIQSLPQGYETNVGSKGTQFSGGQKQRVAIARALLKNPKILLLDEATSALDAESEKIVQEALDKARAGRTCITIAHRLSTIKDADKIAVFKGGVVQEIGTHAQLMSKRGLYHRLVLTQSGKQS